MEGNRDTFISGERYTFELYRTDAGFGLAGAALVQTREVGGSNYAYAFEGLTFREAGVYHFVVKETRGDQAGVTYDASEYHVTIHVAKERNGNTTILAADAVIHKLGNNAEVAADALNFTNTYTISETETVTLSGIKNLVGRPLLANEFAFGLYAGDTLVQSVKNRGDGTFAFAPITYTAADIGAHTYTIREIIPATKAPGMIYDGTAYTVTVTVKDDNAGGLTVSVAAEEVVFTNTYEVKPVSVTLNGTKTLYDVDANEYLDLEDSQFTFELYESNESFADEVDKQVTTNNAAGKFSFDLNYDKAGDYYYVVREHIGEQVGMQYDASRYLVHVRISDDGAGQLLSKVTIVHEGVGGAEDIVFSNRYDALTSSANIVGTKVLKGRDLVDGEFSFELYENDVLVQTVTNLNGKFVFDAIEYTQAGVYTYKVIEHNPAQNGNVHNGVVYDTTEYTVTVTVADVDGTLQATVSHDDQQLVFINELYAEPPVGPPDNPKTGDSFAPELFVSLMVISSFGLAAVLVSKKREDAN